MFDFFSYSFMVRALLAGVLVALEAPLIGGFLVARRASLLTDTLAHTALAGVGVGLLLGISPVWGAMGISLLAVLGIEKIITRGKLGPEAVHALFLSGSLAIAVLLVHFSPVPISFENFLFGSLASVTNSEIWFLAVIGFFLLLLIFFYWRQLLNLSFHEELSIASGHPVKFLKICLATLTALFVALSLKIVGGLLIGALMVTPVLAAIPFSKNFRTNTIVAIGIAESSVLLGLITSYYWDLPTGAIIVLFTLGFFILSLLFRGRT